MGSGDGPRDRRVVLVVGGKGGTGATTIALALAALSARSGRLTLIADAAPGRRQLAATLGIDAAPPPDGFISDRATLLRVIGRGPANVHILPPLPLTPRLVGEHLRVLFDSVIIDMPAGSGGDSDGLAGCADGIVVVTSAMRASLRETARLLCRLDSPRTAPRHCVLNRNEANTDVDHASASAILRCEVAVHLPYDPALVAAAANTATPVSVQAPASDFTRRLTAFAATLGLIDTGAGAEPSDDGTSAGPDSVGLRGHGRRLDRALRFRRR